MNATIALATVVASAVASLCAAATALGADAVTARSADVIVMNGHVITEDAKDSIAQAVAIRNGRILAVGTNEAIGALARRNTRVIDLHGLTVTPGLIDTHAHVLEGGLDALRSVDLSGATSIADVRRLVAERAATLTPGSWLLGSGWDEGKLAERRYVKASDLDDVSPANPVWLEHTTGHYGVANSAALHLAHIEAATADPPAGTIDRDPDGRPTGVLKEAAQELAEALIPDASTDERRRALLLNIGIMHSEGMTGFKEPGINEAEWAAYQSLANDHGLTAHACILWRWRTGADEPTARALAQRLSHLPRPPALAAPNLMSCGIKIFMDGSGGARTAWMYEDWNRNRIEVDTGNKGYPSIDPAVYRDAVRTFHGAGLHVATHAIGDRAIDWVVDTYAEVLRERPTKGLRHAIIHANTPTDHALDVMQALQRDYDAGYPETQAEFTWWIGDNYAGNLGTQRSARLNPYQTYVKRGIHFGGGSDYPVTPLPARYGLWASAMRTTLRGTYGAQPFGTAESISAADALRSYTTWAAHELFLDAETGSLEPGKSADLAVWDRDVLNIPPNELKDLKCEMTLFRGAVVYQAPGAPLTTAISGKAR